MAAAAPAIVGIIMASVVLEPASAAPALSGLDVHLDNDEFTGLNKRDRWYTSGARVSYWQDNQAKSKTSFTVGWASRLRRYCPATANAGAAPGRSHIGIGQNIYSQERRLRPVPVSNDRPIAAYLYGSAGNILNADNGDVAVAVELGVTGPAALGEPIQNSLHNLLGVGEVPAWSYQLRPRLGLNAHFQCLNRIELGPGRMLTQYAVSVGTTIARASLAAAWAFGPGSPYAALPDEARYSVPGRRNPGSWSALVGVRAILVGYDWLLDGNTYRYQSATSSKAVATQFFAGFGLTFFDDWRLDYVYTRRSNNFDGPASANAMFGRQSIGTIVLRIPIR